MSANDFISREAVRQYMRSMSNGMLFTEWELDQIPRVQNWIPVSEQMPKPGRRVLVYHNGFEGWRVGVGMNLDFNNMFQVFSGRHEAWTDRVTHWMPLPEPPKEVI